MLSRPETATLNGAVLNYDQWDGYPVQRQRILQHLADNSVPNVVPLPSGP